MTKDDIQLLFEYDRWANNRVLQAGRALTPEQFTRDLAGSFACVRDTVLHLIAGEWIWLAYWKAEFHSPDVLAELRTRREALFRPDAFVDAAAVWMKWAAVEKEQIDFMTGLTDEALDRMFPTQHTQIGLAHLMQHLANHSTYHRGQVALMMRQVGAEPLATDFHVFIAEKHMKTVPAR